MAFETFGHNAAKRVVVDFPVISIQANLTMRLNKSAVNILQHPERALLSWDEQTNEIGVSEGKSEDTRSYKISYANGTAKIGAKAFLKYIRFAGDTTVSLTARLVKGWLTISVPDENIHKAAAVESSHTVKKKNRTHKRTQGQGSHLAHRVCEVV
jgi:hypothetical protein